MNAADDTRHDRLGTVRASMVRCGDQGSWSMSVIWRVRRAGVVYSSGDVRYRVDSGYYLADMADTGLERE